jgi:hypothetical protein
MKMILRLRISLLLIAIIVAIFLYSKILIVKAIDLDTNPKPSVYYVSTKGCDSNPGTISSPWKSIQKAANTVKQGDTVFIRGGTYKERVVLNSSGSENNYITFTNYPKEVVTIDGTGIDWGYDWSSLFNLNSQQYIKVRGLRMINSNWFGIGSASDYGGCKHVIIQKCSTYNTKSSGIAFFTGTDITIDGNTVEKACTNSDNAQENISLACISTFVIKNNHVFDCDNTGDKAGGEGIDAKDGCTNGSIYNNTINNIAKIGIYIDAYSEDQYNIEVYGNKVYNCGQGITVATENGGLLQNVNIHNNLVYSCSWGLTVANWDSGSSHAMKDIYFLNNTVYNCEEFDMWLGNAEAKNVVVKNNIFGGGTHSGCIPVFRYDAKLSEVTIDHNLLYKVVSGQPKGTNNIVGDPEFVNPSNFDFHLAGDSIAINAGLTSEGKACNMGAF